MTVNLVSGKYAAVNGVGSVFSWNLAQSKPSETVRHSATQGGTGRIPGIDDYTGSYIGAGGTPAVMPGDSFAFKGYVGATGGSRGGAGPTYALTAVCTSVVIVWDWTTRKLIRHTVNFGSDSALTIVTSDSAILDVSTPIMHRIGILPTNAFIYGGSSTPIDSKKTATLTISSDVQVIANSDTGAFKRRVAGPIDWTLSIDWERGDNPVPSDSYLDTLKLFVNATEYWLMDYGLVAESTNIKADTETGAIASQTLNINMSAFKADGTLGSITKPGAVSAWWPQSV